MRTRHALLFCCLIAGAAAAQELNVVTSVEVKDEGGAVLVTVRGSKQPNFTTFSMADPPRFVIDMSESRFQGVPESLAGENGVVSVVKNLSYGSGATSIARVMMAFTAEVEPPDVQAVGNDLVVRVLRPVGAKAVAVVAAAPAAPAAPAADASRLAEARAAEAKAAEAKAAEAKAAGEAEAARLVATKAESDLRAKAEAQAAEAKVAAEAEAARVAEARAAVQKDGERQAAEAEARAKAEAEAARLAKADAVAAQAAAAKAEAAARAEASARAVADAAAKAEAEKQARELARADAAARAKAEAEAAKAAIADQKARAAAELQARAEAKKKAAEEAAAAKSAAAEAMAADKRAAAEAAAADKRAAAEAKLAASKAAKAQRSGDAEVVTTPLASDTGTRVVHLPEVGFRQLSGTSRVFVHVASLGRYSVTDVGDDLVRVVVENTQASRRNNTRFLDTSFFNSPVALITPTNRGSSYVVDIKLNHRVPYSKKVNGDVLAIDFERPAGEAEAAPPAAAPEAGAASADPAAENPPKQ